MSGRKMRDRETNICKILISNDFSFLHVLTMLRLMMFPYALYMTKIHPDRRYTVGKKRRKSRPKSGDEFVCVYLHTCTTRFACRRPWRRRHGTLHTHTQEKVMLGSRNCSLASARVAFRRARHEFVRGDTISEGKNGHAGNPSITKHSKYKPAWFAWEMP